MDTENNILVMSSLYPAIQKVLIKTQTTMKRFIKFLNGVSVYKHRFIFSFMQIFKTLSVYNLSVFFLQNYISKTEF